MAWQQVYSVIINHQNNPFTIPYNFTRDPNTPFIFVRASLLTVTNHWYKLGVLSLTANIAGQTDTIVHRQKIYKAGQLMEIPEIKNLSQYNTNFYLLGYIESIKLDFSVNM